MHKCLLWIGCAAVLAVPQTLQADQARAWSEQVDVGLHAGMDLATIGGSELNDEGVDYSHRAGFTGGVGCGVRLTRMVSVQLAVDFASKGYRADTNAPSTSVTSSVDYLEIPILVALTVPVSAGIEPYGYVGPALGIRLASMGTFDDGRRIDTTDRVEPVDIGLMVGAGTAVEIGKVGDLTFDLRYNFGLRNWSKIATSENEVLHRVIYLTVGYRADLATLGRLFGGGPR
jgi:opacity protein-like surface antigen